MLSLLTGIWDKLTNREKPQAARQVLEQIAAPAAIPETSPGEPPPAPDVAPATQYTETPEQSARINELFQEAARLSLNTRSLHGVFLVGVGRHAIGSTTIGAELRRACLEKLSNIGVATGNKKTARKFGVLQQGITDVLGQLQVPSESPALAFFQANKENLAVELAGQDVDEILTNLRSGKTDTFDVMNQLLRGNGKLSKKLRIQATGSEDMLPSIGDTSRIGGANDLLRFSGLSNGLIPNIADVARIKRAHGKWTMTWDTLKQSGINLMIAVVIYNMFSAEGEGHGQGQH